VRGSLFTQDFLNEGIAEQPDWRILADAEVEQFAQAARAVYAAFPVDKDPNEARTEDDLIHPLVELLGWKHRIPQANLSPKHRRDVPDSLLFDDAAAKVRADAEMQPERKFLHGCAILESKRWRRELDKAASDGTPSSQILRYLNRADIHSAGHIKWGILTNGRKWRLYWQDAKSRLEDFVELDLPVILGVPDIEHDLFDAPEAASPHHLKLFLLLFRRQSFGAGVEDSRGFHRRAIEATRNWEARVTDALSDVVFDRVFPALVRGLVAHDPERPDTLTEDYLDEVRRAALVWLYRLLFLFYAEDRNLLPVDDRRYDDYSLRAMRDDIERRIDAGSVDGEFSATQDRYDHALKTLFRAVDGGDSSLGLPPYNGGLFQAGEYPILDRTRLPDALVAPVIDRLSHDGECHGRKRINYRDLSVQQLGSIYERLLEFAAVADDAEPGGVLIRPNIFARKGSGSYYTPDGLVGLIVRRTLAPLIEERWQRFVDEATGLAKDRRPVHRRLSDLAAADPATAVLDLKVCDPAMGSGHFLVFVVDHLADTVLRLTEEAAAHVDWSDDYQSPVLARVETIRERIVEQARAKGWAIDEQRLDPRHIVRRMLLKRVVYGVDKNPMAVELAKVSLWLHTFTVGAPLSFLDHHLRCGDSLYGEFVRPVEDFLRDAEVGMFINSAVQRARNATRFMHEIEDKTDASIAEVSQSAGIFANVETETGGLLRFLDFFHALRWLDRIATGGRLRLDDAARTVLEEGVGRVSDFFGRGNGPVEEGEEDEAPALFDDGEPKQLHMLSRRERTQRAHQHEVRTLLADARAVAERERFLHWQVAFPGVWDNWESAEPTGGFDAIVGNPPWDRIKLQEVEWFAERRPEIARQPRASDRKRLVAKLKEDGDRLADLYEVAKNSAEAALRVARHSGYYPLLSSGDINLYSLFVERATALVKPDGMLGLLVPSGIAADMGASRFFKGVATSGRLAALFDFENRRRFFPEVDSRFKFSAFIAGGEERRFDRTDTAFFLHSVAEIDEPDRAFPLAAEDFARVNPNTGTAPIFRTRRDADITRAIYERLPVLHDRAKGEEGKVWPVRYLRMFDLTNDAHLFRTRTELEAEGFYPVEENRLRKGDERFVPLYEGKMVQAFDHRAASVVVNPANLNRPAQPVPARAEQHADPNWFPDSQHWIEETAVGGVGDQVWAVAFKDITSSTNMRTMIAAAIPSFAAGNSLPLVVRDGEAEPTLPHCQAAMLANFNALAFDYVARQKVQGNHLNWYIVEQLPVVPPEGFERRFGDRTAAEIVAEHVLRLTYTAWDMRPFARDMGWDGEPFAWDEDDRRRRRAALDALFFLLYGVEDEDDVRYILSTFPIVRRDDEAAFGDYRTERLILAHMNALRAGDTDAEIAL